MFLLLAIYLLDISSLLVVHWAMIWLLVRIYWAETQIRWIKIVEKMFVLIS